MSAPQNAPEDHPVAKALSVLDGEGTQRRLWIVAAIVAVLLALLDVVVGRKDYFQVPENFGFYFFAGFFAVVVGMLLTWPLGRILKKPTDYYEDERR